ncbi:uncharacterized protein LOC144641794 isoform X1 [Oculina patagonica]
MYRAKKNVEAARKGPSFTTSMFISPFKMDRIQRQNDALAAKVAHLEETLANYKRIADAKENNDLLAELLSEQKNNKRQLEAKQEALCVERAQMTTLKRRLKQERSTISRQSARIKELEGLTGEVQVLERQKEDLKNRISDKEHELANCLDKITQLEQVNLQLEASGEKMASAKLDAEAVHRVQIEKLEEQHRSAADSKELELAECVRKIAQLEQDKVQEKSRTEELTQNQQQLQDQCQRQLEEARMEAMKHTAKIQELETQHASEFTRYRLEAKIKLNEQENKIEELRKQCADLLAKKQKPKNSLLRRLISPLRRLFKRN